MYIINKTALSHSYRRVSLQNPHWDIFRGNISWSQNGTI